MSSKKKDKILILPDGEEVRVLKESGKYFICKGRKFRKGNDAVRVEMREREKEAEIHAQD